MAQVLSGSFTTTTLDNVVVGNVISFYGGSKVEITAITNWSALSASMPYVSFSTVDKEDNEVSATLNADTEVQVHEVMYMTNAKDILDALEL